MGVFAGAWLRVSTGGQDEANQVPDVTAWITGHDYELRKTYRLHGKSASKGEQQGAIDQMLADMRAGLITVLVVWAADRIERRGALSALTLAEQVREAGGRIEYVKDAHLNAANEMSDVMLSLAATMARQETTRKRERVAVAHKRSRDNGAMHGRPEWGYAIEGAKYAKRLVPTDEGKRLVPEMFRRCYEGGKSGSGESLADIAAWMNEQTWPGAPFTYERWWPHTIGNMIRNPVYRGTQVDGQGRVIHRVAEPLVSASAFRRAGEALASRPKRGPAKAANRAMLATAVYCPRCEDSPMYRIMAGHGASRAAYYRCAGRGAARKGCGNMVRLDAVEAAVNRIVAEVFDVPVMTHTVVPGNAAEVSARLEEIRFEIRQLAADLGDDDSEYDRRLTELRAERDRVKAAPVLPDRVELSPTGERYAELWARTPVPERGPWLARHGFRVTASRAGVRVTQGNVAGERPLAQ
jgi:DNA invertase Pin-like site-specific DNA recombinase